MAQVKNTIALKDVQEILLDQPDFMRDIISSICRDREGTFQPQLFARYQRNEKALVMVIIEMYFKGVSTRKVEPILEELCGLEISKSQVSELTKKVEQEIQAWKNRRLVSVYSYLFVDAMFLKVRENGTIVSRAVLVGIGVTVEGYREVIACENADTESEQGWAEFFKKLKERGLQGVRLVFPPTLWMTISGSIP